MTEDDGYRFNAFDIYEKNNLKEFINVYTGKIKGNLDRKLVFTLLCEEV